MAGCGKPVAFRKRPSLNALMLSLVDGKAEPFRTSGGRAAIFSLRGQVAATKARFFASLRSAQNEMFIPSKQRGICFFFRAA